MKILHIAAHLGGGVGKAHSALCAAADGATRRHYLLLEQPRDLRYVDLITRAGADVSVARGQEHVRRCVAEADIVQIEWWNHPRLYECLALYDLPAARTVIWSHISGLFPPYLPDALYAAPDRLLFTSVCSLSAPHLRVLTPDARNRIGVVNSGFGFAEETVAANPVDQQRSGEVAYLGTVHFSKLSPAFFDVIDQAALERPVSVWGAFDQEGEVTRYAAGMKVPGRVRFRGHTDQPETVFARSAILLYLLQPRHFGTAENALIEAMSLGCVPLVFDNPAESAIVDHGRTGFVEADSAAAARRLAWMIENPAAIARMGEAAAAAVATTRTPRRSVADFAAIYRAVLSCDKRKTDYATILGTTPAEWFLSTQDGEARGADGAQDARKGSLAHFVSCFPEDSSLRDAWPASRRAARG